MVLPSECKDVAQIMDSNVMEGTVAAAAVTSTVDLRKSEARMGHLHPNERQRLCSSWNMQLNRQDQDCHSHVKEITKRAAVPRDPRLRKEDNWRLGEHLACDDPGNRFETTVLGNHACMGSPI